MPKAPDLKHAIICFRNDYTTLYAFRSLSSDNRNMAEMLSHITSPRMLSLPEDRITRIGATRQGSHPSFLESPDKLPASKRRHSRIFLLEHDQLTVTEPNGKISYTGPLAGFIAANYSLIKTSRAIAAHERKMERQRRRRAERKDLLEYGKQHAKAPPELRAKLKIVSLEEAERQIKLRKK